MYSKHARIHTIIVALILVMTVPSLAGIEMAVAGNGSDTLESGTDGSKQTNYQPLDTPWSYEIPIQIPRSSPSQSPWWVITSRDMDRNGIVDSLETGNDVVPVIVSYSRTPKGSDLSALEELGILGGYVIETIDAVSIGIINPLQYPIIASLPDVVMVEPIGKLIYFSDVATRNLKARGSAEYSPYSAWEYTDVSGSGINIAVVDTGIDDGHPSLEGKRVAGYDAVTPESNTDGTTNPDDRNGHGTSCSGMATGTSAGDPELRYMGSAPNASLIDVQIGTDIGAGPFENYLLPTTYYDSALRGLEWVRDNADTEWGWVGPDLWGVDVMSLSWGITSHENGGSDGSDPFSRLIDELVDAGIVCVGAAGNDGPSNDGLSGMSASSKSIIVGATNDLNTIDRGDDIIASYSSRGPRKDNGDGYPYDELKPDVSAPGTNINNCEPATWPDYGDAEGNGYEGRGSGTSYATPAVAGVTALLLDVNGNLTPALVKEILHLTSERRGPATLPELDPFWNRDFGYGIVDAYEAVKTATELDPDELDSIDIELQAHFTNVTESPKGNATLEGLAWAKVGSIDRVEVSINGGPWKEVIYQEALNGSLGAGEYINWKFEVKQSYFGSTGNHTARVRAVSKETYSLSDSVIFHGKEEDDDDWIGTFEIALISTLMLIAILAVAVLALRKNVTPDEPDQDVEWEH